MRPSFQRRCLLWLLPLLAARALVPAGFMPAVAHGSLALGFCADGGVALHATHPGHAATQAAGSHAGGAHTGSECPFAQSAGPLLGAATPAPSSAPPPAAFGAPLVLTSVPSLAPWRHAAPRGPPSASSTTA